MSTDRLAVYNIALAAMGERSLDTLTDSGEARRVLDEIWTRGGGAIKFFLEQGHWNHAMRAIKIDASTSVDPDFGFTYAFDKPSDFVRLNQISSGEHFGEPLTRYEFEANYIYADVDPIYMRYVSDDSDYGNDLSLWPETFTLWAGQWMAVQIAPRLKNDLDMDRLEKRERRLRADARSKDASQEPVRFPPVSTWVRARWGSSYRRDRGSRNTLIG